MSRPPILSGYIPTPVPGPAEIPTPLPGPVIVPTAVPGPVVVDTEIPGPVIVPTALPGPTIVPTVLPFWIQKVMGLIQAQAEIQVQVLNVGLDGSAALEGSGEIQAHIRGIETGAPTQYLRGRVRISALVGMALPAGLKTLAGRGAVLVQNAKMALPGGTRLLGGRGQISATRTGFMLKAGTKTLEGRGAVQVISAGYPTMAAQTQTFTASGTYSLPYWWRYLDIVMIGGGASGQTGNGANGQAGKGGNPATWVTVTLERGVDVPAMATTITVVVGTGGATPANSDLAGPNPGGYSLVTGSGMSTVSSSVGFGTASGQNGASPGNVTYQTITRTGGSAGTGNGGSATAPGASGAGGNGGVLGSRTRGGAGASGEVVLRVRQ